MSRSHHLIALGVATERGHHPLWLPDERTIAFLGPREGNQEFSVINADGTSDTRDKGG